MRTLKDWLDICRSFAIDVKGDNGEAFSTDGLQDLFSILNTVIDTCFDTGIINHSSMLLQGCCRFLQQISNMISYVLLYRLGSFDAIGNRRATLCIAQCRPDSQDVQSTCVSLGQDLGHRLGILKGDLIVRQIRRPDVVPAVQC